MVTANHHHLQEKVMLLVQKITSEPKQSPVATDDGSHGNKDVDVCVVTKKGVTREDEIKLLMIVLLKVIKKAH